MPPASASTPNTAGAIARIVKEIAALQVNTDLSLAVAHKDSDVRTVRGLIIGPPETPYEFGFFEFDIRFPKDYPLSPPSVRLLTTNGGRCRFNPNLYNCGKVCLSILGTWRGEKGEEWSSAQGLESLMLSVQSLMSANPYENEPGYEDRKKTEPLPDAYVKKIRHETLRIAVIQRLEGLLGIEQDRFGTNRGGKSIKRKADALESVLGASDDAASPGAASSDDGVESGTPVTEPSIYEYDAEATFTALDTQQYDPFADIVKRRFLWYYDTYIATVDKHAKEQKDGTHFERMEFEYPPNSMEGTFAYASLRTRLERIKKALDDELTAWQTEGRRQVKAETQLATQLAFQFKQLQHTWNEGSSKDGSRLELSLPDPSNPFTWNLTLFGRPMTNLDGGIFNLTLSIPPTFGSTTSSAEQPRVKVETPLFHHRVSTTGTLCYFPQAEDSVASHLEAIVEVSEDANPRFDPRAVMDPESFGLFWGGEEKRKVYGRKLRRSAQDSCEF